MAQPYSSHFLIQCLPEIRDRIDIDHLQVYLLAKECVREDDLPKLKVSAERSTNQVVVDLVLTIKRNGHEDRFLEALRQSTDHSGHRELVRMLEEEKKRIEEQSKDDRGSLLEFLTSTPTRSEPKFSASPHAHTKLSTSSDGDNDTAKLLLGDERYGDDPDKDTVRGDRSAGNVVHVEIPQLQPTMVVVSQEDNQQVNQEIDQQGDQLPPTPIDPSNTRPYSWKPFLIGMVCMGLIAGGLAVIINGVRGDTCTLGERSTAAIHAFNVMFGLLCLSMPVLWLILLIHQILTEYNHSLSIRRLLIGGALIWLLMSILGAITELIFSFFIAGPVYDNFNDVINANDNTTTPCSRPVYITAFVSLTLLYATAFFLLAILVLYLVFSIGTAKLKKQLVYAVSRVGAHLMDPEQ